MSCIKYNTEPRGVLPRATGLPDDILKMGKLTKEQLLEEHYSILGWFFKQAVANPGVTQRRYHEENGYEYEDRATYDETTNTITTNILGCPIFYSHHIGQTCSMCGLKD